jgi:hypothetical protein
LRTFGVVEQSVDRWDARLLWSFRRSFSPQKLHKAQRAVHDDKEKERLRNWWKDEVAAQRLNEMQEVGDPFESARLPPELKSATLVLGLRTQVRLGTGTRIGLICAGGFAGGSKERGEA